MPTGQPSLIGATIGNYRVVSTLGEGGMGMVYLAEHPLIGKRVALKVLHPELAANPDVVTRFFNEARAVNEIGHPNIVDVVDYGVLQRPGQPNVVYFIMELLQGVPLRDLLLHEAPLPPERAVRISMQIADALAASHHKGVIHRDLKPDNVYLIRRGREVDFVKVLDFGIAKLTGGGLAGGPGELSRTRTGVVMGTPAYMSPEQCEGKRGIDARTDVYALGVMLYEMITGKVPFTGEGYGEVIMQHMTIAPVRPTTHRGVIPQSIEAIVMKALEKKRDRRFGSMEQMIVALRDPEAFLANEGAYTDAPSARATTVPGIKRRDEDALRATVSASGAPSSTTLSRSAAELGVTRQRGRPAVIAASALVVLGALGAGAFLMLRRGPTVVEDDGPVVAAPPPAPAPVAAPPAPTPVAPPPVVEPVPTPVTPEVPTTITLTVHSSPPDADVFLPGETESRGRTPVVLQLPRGDGDVELTLRREGYKDKTKVVRASRDTELEVMLEKAPRKPRRPTDAETPATPSTPAKPPASDEEILPPTF